MSSMVSGIQVKQGFPERLSDQYDRGLQTLSKAISQSPQVEVSALQFRSTKHTFSVDHWHRALKFSFLLMIVKEGVR